MTPEDLLEARRDFEEAKRDQLGYVRCTNCDGNGFVVIEFLAASITLPLNWSPIERCRVCGEYETNEQAARAYMVERDCLEIFHFASPISAWGVRESFYDYEARDVQGTER